MNQFRRQIARRRHWRKIANRKVGEKEERGMSEFEKCMREASEMVLDFRLPADILDSSILEEK